MKRNCSDTIIIIGAGISGLAAGCYAQMNGYRTQIFEMHDRPGGLCTAWRRQGFIFDGSVVAMSGRNIIQQICREDKQTFRTITP